MAIDSSNKRFAQHQKISNEASNVEGGEINEETVSPRGKGTKGNKKRGPKGGRKGSKD
jgi:hypothetical protein